MLRFDFCKEKERFCLRNGTLGNSEVWLDRP